MSFITFGMLYKVLLTPLMFFGCLVALGQQSKDIVFAVTTLPNVDSTKRQLRWVADGRATSYLITRRSSRWDDYRQINLPNNAATRIGYTDTALVPKVAYSYVVTRNTASSASGLQQGYLMAGYKLPAPDQRGTLAIVVEKLMADSLPVQIGELIADAKADGYQVIYQVVRATDSVVTVRRWLRAQHRSYPLSLISLIGHVPVPYAGFITPDGHQDHKGAWPADGIYGDLSQDQYTDVNVNETQATRAQNKNIPRDTKYDQNFLQSNRPAEQVGIARVDFANMPSFAARGVSEVGLMRRYLAKLHRYKTGEYKAQKKAFIDDNFGYRGGEAFAAGGWTNSYAILGESAVKAANFIPWIDSVNYLIGYGCGGGSYTSAGGVGSTADFVRDSLNVVFTMLFGSYHGDWDVSDNFMRAILASRGSTLACSWDGRPHHVYHPLSMGGTLGDCARLTMLNDGDIVTGFGPRMAHIGFLGDPTLRAFYPKPPGRLRTRAISGGVRVSWQFSAEPELAGYYIYRGLSDSGEFARVGDRLIPVGDTVFVDGSALNGTFVYLVKAVKLETWPGGSYYNTSLAAKSAPVSIVTESRQRVGEGINVFPNPARQTLDVTVTSGLKVSKIVITDAAGNHVMSPKPRELSTSSLYRLDVSGLAPGVYAIRAEGAGEVIVAPFVKE